jgi:hypothetical protein
MIPLDEVEERQTVPAVALGDRDDQPQIGLDQHLLGSGPRARPGERDLLTGTKEPLPGDRAQEAVEAVGHARVRRP